MVTRLPRVTATHSTCMSSDRQSSMPCSGGEVTVLLLLPLRVACNRLPLHPTSHRPPWCGLAVRPSTTPASSAACPNQLSTPWGGLVVWCHGAVCLRHTAASCLLVVTAALSARALPCLPVHADNTFTDSSIRNYSQNLDSAYISKSWRTLMTLFKKCIRGV